MDGHTKLQVFLATGEELRDTRSQVFGKHEKFAGVWMLPDEEAEDIY